MVENSIPPNSKERLSKISLERQEMANSSFKSFPPDQFRYHPIYIYIYIQGKERGKSWVGFLYSKLGEDRCSFDRSGKVSQERDTERVVRLSCSFHPVKLRLFVLVFVAAVIVHQHDSSCETVDARPPI